MLQLHPALNLLNAYPIQPSLQLPERPEPLHGLCVLAPVQELHHLPAADDGGGLVWALPCGRARPAHEPLELMGAVNGARNRGVARKEG